MIEKVADKNPEEVKDDLRTISNIPYVLVLLQVMQHLPEGNRKRAAID